MQFVPYGTYVSAFSCPIILPMKTLTQNEIEQIAHRVAELLKPNTPIKGIRGLANYLAVGINRAQDIKNSGEIPYRANGNRIIFNSRDVDAWMEEHTTR